MAASAKKQIADFTGTILNVGILMSPVQEMTDHREKCIFYRRLRSKREVNTYVHNHKNSKYIECSIILSANIICMTLSYNILTLVNKSSWYLKLFPLSVIRKHVRPVLLMFNQSTFFHSLTLCSFFSVCIFCEIIW